MRPLRVAQWKARRWTSSWRTLPSFVVIGAPRSGTTTLFTMLTSHPDVRAPHIQEVHFFNRTSAYEEGLARYRAYFPLKATTLASSITGEGTSVYMFRPNVAERIRSTLPDVRLIAVLRDPVERAIAGWQHFSERGEERRELYAAVEEEIGELGGDGGIKPDPPQEVAPGTVDFAHVHKGRYVDQLEKWYSVFPKAQIHVVKSERLFASPETVLAETLDFLGLEEREPAFPVAGGQPSPAADVDRAREILRSYYRIPNQELADLLGWSESWGY